MNETTRHWTIKKKIKHQFPTTYCSLSCFLRCNMVLSACFLSLLPCWICQINTNEKLLRSTKLSLNTQKLQIDNSNIWDHPRIIGHAVCYLQQRASRCHKTDANMTGNTNTILKRNKPQNGSLIICKRPI